MLLNEELAQKFVDRIIIQRKEFMLNEIKTCVKSNNQDIISITEHNKIIVLKTIKTEDENSIKEELLEYINEIIRKLNEAVGIKLLVGIGTLHKPPLGLKGSYKEAESMIKMGRRLKINIGIFSVTDHIFEYLFTKIPDNYLEHFLLKYYEVIKEKKEIIETIEALLNNNMNINKTSKELFVHRNTVIFRFNKIKDMLGIDPLKNDEDRILLRFLILYIRYKKNK